MPHGRQEHKVDQDAPGSSFANLPERAQRALAGLDLQGVGLEIGPSFNPIAPRSAGFDVRILDHASQADLIGKYREVGLTAAELDRIEEVDFVWSSGPVHEAVTSGERFSYIVAAHVIEHVTDIVALLDTAQRLLEPGGQLSLIVPDKRFCFDRMRPVTTVGQVVEAHLDPALFHGPAPFIDTHLYTVRKFGTGNTWDLHSGTDLRIPGCEWDTVRDTITRVHQADEYIDIHRWVFTPASLRLLISDLRSLGYTDMDIVQITPTDSFEFFARLAVRPRDTDSDAGVDSADRWALLQKIEREQAEVALADDLARAAQYDELAEHLDEVSSAFRATLAERDALANANAELTEKLAAMTSSASWRATAPLRRAKSIIQPDSE